MYEFRCTENGIYYFDPVIRGERFASNTLLFLIGYVRTFGDNYVSDKLFIPHTIIDPDGKPVALANYDFLLSARSYLTTLDKVETNDVGDIFELYGLTLVLEQIGFLNYYSSTNSNFSSYNRVPHIPLFTKRSQDYTRVYNILTRKEYWGESRNPEKGRAGYSQQPLYSLYNKEYHNNRAEYLDLYNSFGSIGYMTNVLYPTELKGVVEYNDMCSWFIWDSLSFTTLYQFSLGALYGMSQLGYGMLPYTNRPTYYAKDFKYLTYIDEAFFWFQNTPFNLMGTNNLFNVDAQLFRIDTYDNKITNRILSSSVDQNYINDLNTNTYSVNDGYSWMSLNDFSKWAREHDNAYPVTDYTTLLYRGDIELNLPLSDWEW